MSVEAVASAWARREDAPEGAVVLLDSEVAGRLRGGEPWTMGGDQALMMAMVARPEIDPRHEALLWLPASIAAADCLSAATGEPQEVCWPDRVADRQTSTSWGFVNVNVQLGPGRVDHAVFSTRVDFRQRFVEGSSDVGHFDFDADAMIEAYVSSARKALRQLRDDPELLRELYTVRCALMGESIRARLLPRGEARGRVVAIDADGFLVLESSTGMLEGVAPATLDSIEILTSGGPRSALDVDST